MKLKTFKDAKDLKIGNVIYMAGDKTYIPIKLYGVVKKDFEDDDKLSIELYGRYQNTEEAVGTVRHIETSVTFTNKEYNNTYTIEYFDNDEQANQYYKECTKKSLEERINSHNESIKNLTEELNKL